MTDQSVPRNPNSASLGSRRGSFAVTLTWLTTLSLDAPLVCLGWLWLLASSGPTRPTTAASLVLVLSVWLAYMGDRWFDSWRLKQPVLGSHRHRFVHRHRKALAIVWMATLAFTVHFAIATLDRGMLQRGFLLLAVVLVYFAAIHLGPRTLRSSIPREVATAAILVSGILLFLPGRMPPWPVSAALGLLFFANCIMIGNWETGTDRTQGFGSLAGRFSFSVSLTRITLIGLATLSAILVFSGTSGPWSGAWAAVGTSAIFLLLLGLISRRGDPALLRPLSDIALMTPWLMLLLPALHPSS